MWKQILEEGSNELGECDYIELVPQIFHLVALPHEAKPQWVNLVSSLLDY